MSCECRQVWWLAKQPLQWHCAAKEPRSDAGVLAHRASCYGYWCSTSQVWKLGEKDVAFTFKVMTLAIFQLFLLKVVNCHYSPKLQISSFDEILCKILMLACLLGEFLIRCPGVLLWVFLRVRRSRRQEKVKEEREYTARLIFFLHVLFLKMCVQCLSQFKE